MQNAQNWQLLFKHLTNDETPEETLAFTTWLHQSPHNRRFFTTVEEAWKRESVEESFMLNIKSTFRKKFTGANIQSYIVNQALGNLIGFVIGVWVVSTFTHKIIERKSLKNLFGLLERKKVIVNDIPIWMQNTLAILIGYMVLEMIAFFFQSRMHILIGKQIRLYVKRMHKSNESAR